MKPFFVCCLFLVLVGVYSLELTSQGGNIIKQSKDTNDAPKKDNEHYQVAFILPVSAKNRERRMMQRMTWLHDKDPRWTYKYVTGQSDDKKVMSALAEEQKLHGDIVTLPILDNYWNLTQKVVAAAQWAVSHINFDYMMKVDDDTYVQPYKLLDVVKTLSKTKYYGGELGGPYSPDRRNDSKWFISKDEFPTDHTGAMWAFGGAYLMSRDAAVILGNAEKDPKFVPLRFEDVAVGILLSQHNIRASKLWGANDKCFTPCPNITFAHRCQERQFKGFYSNFIKNGDACIA